MGEFGTPQVDFHLSMAIEAVFSDRDGVIIENRPNYVRTKEDAVFLPGALESCARLADAGIPLILVTNQSAVGRGLVPLNVVEEIQQSVVEKIQAAGGNVSGSYLCPCTPEENCDCRKPKPGMLIQAATELGLNPINCVMVGDAITDLQAGWAVGCQGIMVETGRGKEQWQLLSESEMSKTIRVKEFSEAVDWVLETSRR